MWGSGALELKPQLVRWALVCLDKGKRGLGVKCLSSLNKAFLCKWNWRFANERGALWNQVIRAKYGEKQRGWCSKEERGGYGMGLCKAIRREWHVVSSRLSFVVGNGQRVRFWKDRWCGDSAFWVAFPTLYAIATAKDAWVKDVWSFTKGVGTHISLDPLMIRRWMRRAIFYWVSMGRVFSGMWKIGCFG